MLAWKLCTAAAVTGLLAATTARGDDKGMIVVESGQFKVNQAANDLRPEPLTDQTLINDVASRHAATAKQSEYWLGLFASRPSPALQAQLKLPKDQGLIVEGVQPESPAAKAGIQPYDILLKGNDKPLAGLHDLIQLIDQVKGGKLTLDLLRAGKHETVSVTPAKRPANEAGEMGGLWIPSPEGAVAGGLSGTFGLNLMEGGPLEFRVVRPGQILPSGGSTTSPPGGGPTTLEITVRATSKLADGSTVEITRHGADPAKVVVTHDKDKWEGTSGDLSKIPEKIRPEVEKLLHPAFDHMRVLATAGQSAGGNVTYFGSPVVPPGPGQIKVQPDVEKRLSELQKQVDELRRAVEALQGKTAK